MYMKKHTTIKRLFTLALALAMILAMGSSLAVPVMAEESNNDPPFQITINTNDNISKPDDVSEGDSERTKLESRFWAYQIFIGKISSSYAGGTDEGTDDRIGDPKANQLSNVQWGASINPDLEKKAGLLAALKGISDSAESVGVNFDLMLAAGKTYLEAAAFETGYKAVYNTAENWKDGKIGRELTDEGRTKLEAAFDNDVESLTLGQLFTAALDTATEDKEAAIVAKVLSDFTTSTGNTAMAQAFTAIVAKKDSSGNNYEYLINEGGTAYGGNAGGDYEGAYAVSKWDKANKQWTIGKSGDGGADDLSGGYYLIRDAYVEKDNKVRSDYILAVFGNSTVNPKPEFPTADKTIVGAENPDNGDDFEIGEQITYRLKGTLPENYDTAYSSYIYKFTDTMSKGLTYLGGGENSIDGEGHKDILRFYVKVFNTTGGEFGEVGAKYDYYLVELDESTGEYEGAGYRLSVVKNNDADPYETTVTIDIPNLHLLKGKKATDGKADPWWESVEQKANLIPITNSSEIYVEYTAKLNEDAVINSTDGNINSVKLEYSNDPKGNGTGETDETNITHVYDFGIQIDKQDEEGRHLEGAGFALKRAYPAEVEYVLKNVEGDEIRVFASELGTLGTTNGGDISAEDLSVNQKLGELAGYEGEYSDYTVTAVNQPEISYAILHQVEKKEAVTETDPPGSETPAEYTYYLFGWVTKDALDSYLAGDGSPKDWDDPLEAGPIGSITIPDGGGYYAAIMTQSDGRLRIEGLDSDSIYYLEEVITPDGYDTIDDVSVRFRAEYNEADGKLESLEAEVGGSADAATYTLVQEGVLINVPTELVVMFNVINYPSGYLPGTGGMGTTLFYIAGIALVAGAVLYLIFSNVRKKGQRVR